MTERNSLRDPLAFISYRRRDSSAAARWLFQTIRQSFGPSRVFMDTEDIRAGEDWENRIKSSLSAASVVIPVIGPHWLRLTDDYGRRRIDREDDWVRREILHALQEDATIIPIVLSDTPIPDAEALPKEIGKLLRFQAFRLRDETWEEDLARLMARLSGLGFKKCSQQPIRYPAPHIHIRDLAPNEVDEALSSLPGWGIITSEIPGHTPLRRSEIYKSFEFASFEDAIHFMYTASKHISATDHHPRWENIWRTVTVWLSTWDIGHKISKLDLELSQYLEVLRAQYRLVVRDDQTDIKSV